MLIRLMRSHLRPYRKLLLFIVVLQTVQTAAALALPTINAKIIDNGVHPRRYRLHLEVGRHHADVHARSRPCSRVSAVYFGSKVAMAFGRDRPQQPVPPRH